MSNDWTIDSTILYNVAGVDVDAASFLLNILQHKDHIMLDNAGKIEEEYRNCIKKTRDLGGNSYVRKIFGEFVNKLCIRCDGSLDHSHQKELRKLRFDPDDWKFVAVSSKSRTKRLVAEESDYNEEVKNYLNSSLFINVISVQSALVEQRKI